MSVLRANGHDVVAVVRKATDVPAGVAPVRGDVLDPASIEEAATGCDGVFHCAGKVSRRPEDAEELRRVPVEGTKNELDACIEPSARSLGVGAVSLKGRRGRPG